MQYDYIIVGQGICGTMLSWFLQKEGRTFIVIDDGNEHSSTKVSAGIMNAVTGRRYVTSWMADVVLPFAAAVYGEMGNYLGQSPVARRTIIDFFPTPQARQAFLDRVTDDDTWLHAYPGQNDFNPFFNYDFGCGAISPAWTVNMATLASAWKEKLREHGHLLEQQFDHHDLDLSGSEVRYGDLSAGKIIFCNGAGSVELPWFEKLPFSLNKGEALFIATDESLPRDFLFKRGLIMVPLQDADTFWVGANYQWEFDNAEPTGTYREFATSLLDRWLKVPYRVLDHRAAVRPATLERRPFVGLHPHEDRIGILNGMGTKGASLAPYFANQLVQHLVHGLPLAEEADVKRFSRVLSR